MAYGSGSVTLKNSTISGNTSAEGGGIYAQSQNGHNLSQYHYCQ